MSFTFHSEKVKLIPHELNSNLAIKNLSSLGNGVSCKYNLYEVYVKINYISSLTLEANKWHTLATLPQDACPATTVHFILSVSVDMGDLGDCRITPTGNVEVYSRDNDITQMSGSHTFLL